MPGLKYNLLILSTLTKKVLKIFFGKSTLSKFKLYIIERNML